MSPSFLIGREGSDVEMRCDAFGVPAPSVTWLKDGRQLDVSGAPRVVTTDDARRLVFSHLVRADAGLYTCLFKNSVAQTTHNIRLVVEGRLLPVNQSINQSISVHLATNCESNGEIMRVRIFIQVSYIQANNVNKRHRS